MVSAIEVLQWEELSPMERQVIKGISKTKFDKMVGIWFQLMQGERFIMNWHHIYLCWAAEEIIAGRMRDTIFNVTPGSGKTEIFSIHFPLFGLLNSKKLRNLNISFADSLVKRNSKRVREVISSKEWQALWPSTFGTCKDDEIQIIGPDGKTAVEIISKSARGQITGSRGGYITDYFSGCIMLDDFDKPDDMFSKVKREAGHVLLKNTIRSRRARKQGSPTPIISIQQRLHTQDSTWFMMEGGKGGKPGMGIKFNLITIPALVNEEYMLTLPEWLQPIFARDVLGSECIDGYYSFWPGNESIHDLMALRDADPYTFASQYMQKPMALGGNVFKSEWWRFYGDTEECDIPEPDRYEYRFITADTAQKKGELNDYTVYIEWGKLGDKVYFIDGVREKFEAPELERNFKAFVLEKFKDNKRKGNLRKIYVEDKASGTGLIQALAKKLPVAITPLQRSKDKVTRAMDAQPVIRAGNVVLPIRHRMLDEFLVEHAAFTYDDTHPHDDIVDNTIDAVNEEINIVDDPLARMKRLAGIKKD